MRANNALHATARALIAAIPDDRLRELFVELALSTLVGNSTARAADNGRRGRRPHTAGNGRRRRRRQAVSENTPAPLCGQDQTSRSGRDPRQRHRQRQRQRQRRVATPCHRKRCGSSAEKLEPKQPWRAVARELGISDGASQLAYRNLAMPADVSPVAAARFLTL